MRIPDRMTEPRSKKDIQTLVSRFKQDNAGLIEISEAVLSRIVQHRATHARFLNTLAMLEHLGSYKIMVTQHGSMIDQSTLKHLAEEARHAFFFRRMADREAGRVLSSYPEDSLAYRQAQSYFQRLEARMVRELSTYPTGQAVYLIMSMIVEFRAVWGYEIYKSVLVRANHSISLNGILADESGHLIDMGARLDNLGLFDSDIMTPLFRSERELYRRFIFSLDRAAPPVGPQKTEEPQLPLTIYG